MGWGSDFFSLVLGPFLKGGIYVAKLASSGALIRLLALFIKYRWPRVEELLMFQHLILKYDCIVPQKKKKQSLHNYFHIYVYMHTFDIYIYTHT